VVTETNLLIFKFSSNVVYCKMPCAGCAGGVCQLACFAKQMLHVNLLL